MKQKIVVSGMGIVSPLGNTIPLVWKRILNKEISSKSWSDLSEQGFRSSVACRIENFEHAPYQRGNTMIIAAINDSIKQAKIHLSTNRTGVFIGSTLGESHAFESHAEGAQLALENYTSYALVKNIQKHFSLNGIGRAYGTACAAGNYTIAAGADLLKRGVIDVAIVGGVDPFSRIAMAGFSRTRAMSNNGNCKPFDKLRNGMLLGEGAGCLILEREQDVLNRNIKPLAIIGEIGFTSDAYHSITPNPDGIQMERAMIKAMKKQEIKPKDISWICAHGSGTKISDKTEAFAIGRIFGKKKIPVTGLKGAFGHTLGAATAIEAVISISSLNNQIIPPTVNFDNVDPILPIRVQVTPKKTKIKWVVNCGYAFGGLNSALLLGKWE